MRTYRNVFYLLILSVLCLSLPACGDDDDDNGKFVWKGDWNDPANPGGYNPIEGIWQSEGGGVRRWHTDDLLVKHAYRNEGWVYTVTSKGKYEINDTGFKYTDRINDHFTWLFEYKIVKEDGKTYLMFREVLSSNSGGYGEWKKWEKLK